MRVLSSSLSLALCLVLAACGGGPGQPDWLAPAPDRESAWATWTAERDSLFATPESPIPEVALPEFDGLSYFPYDSTLAFPVALEPVLRADTLRIPTTTGSVQHYVRYGRFTFQLNGRIQHLTAYRSVNRTDVHGAVFVPFTDPTNRTDTYGGGRYLDIAPAGDGRYVLDFNFAYSPYCAYDEAWSCPIPPSENRLAFPITAGERFDENWAWTAGGR